MAIGCRDLDLAGDTAELCEAIRAPRPTSTHLSMRGLTSGAQSCRRMLDHGTLPKWP